MTWPPRKARNQKFRSRNVLEVKPPPGQARRRIRALAYALGGLFAVLLAVYVCYRVGEWGLKRLIYDNPAYTLRTLDVQTDGVIAPEQIRRWAGVKPGDNLFRLDLARMKRDLELIPAIQTVAIERVLPQTLRIVVTEREPIAQIVTTQVRAGAAAQAVVYLLDAAGYVMLPLEARQRAVPPSPAEHYPIITGVPLGELCPGRPVESPQIRAALRLIAAFDASPMAGLVELRSIDVASPEVLTVTTDRQSEVALRTTDLERQLHRWRLIYDTGQRMGREIATLDLSVQDNIPLRWAESPGAPPPTPKTKRPSPYRKKHV